MKNKSKDAVELGQSMKFTCKTCGSHQLNVTHLWNIEAEQQSERWREWGPLKNDHHWHYEFREKIEKNEDDEVQVGAFSDFAEDDSDSEPEIYEIHEQQIERENDEFFVNCGNCDREVEFGWSQIDRRGLIHPTEFSDFIPMECWPDPKYVESWAQRGWLQSSTLPK